MNAAAPNPIQDGAADPRWQAVFARLMQTEGGFVDSPGDPGGATKYGLSLRYLAQQVSQTPSILAELDVNHDGQLDLPDIQDMTLVEAATIYYRFFWLASGVNTLPQPLDAAVFDQVVNDGVVPAIRLLQAAINSLGRIWPPVIEDGVLGPATRTSLNICIHQIGVEAVLDGYRAQAIARYHYIVRQSPTLAQYLAGWLNRAAELGDV